MVEKLRIFVSGKEGELVNERAVAIDLIHFLDFTPIGSEKRPASSESMRKENRGEVSRSDIYIGIFGSIFSEPTINEFRNARMRNIPTLIFEKELLNERREQKLIDFLNEIKDPKTGLVIATYKNVVELKQEILSALSYTLTKKFRDAKRLRHKIQDEENKKANKTFFDTVQKSKDDSLLNKMKTFPFTARFSKQFSKAKFVNFTILSTLKKGEKHIVKAKIKGSTKDGFLDLAIKDPDGVYHWFPEPQSYDSATDNGKLTFKNNTYERQWEFSLPDKSGKYLAIMGLYENNYANREVVNFELLEFTVV